MIRSAVLAAGFALTVTAGVPAHSVTSVRVTGVWSRPALAGDTGVVYATLAAAPGSGDRLLAVESPVATSVEMHRSVTVRATAGGAAHGMTGMAGMPASTMTMDRVESVAVPSGRAVSFAPGGYHVMLIDLHHALVAGGTFPVTFVFARAGRIVSAATVRPW